MAIRSADAEWNGNLKEGSGTVKLESGTFDGKYSFESRFEEGGGTNPEELIAAAHAACYSMALSHGLSQAGHPPERVKTTAKVHLDKGADGFRIPKIELVTEGYVSGISADDFDQQAQTAKENCPVSKVLAGAEITLQAKLVQ